MCTVAECSFWLDFFLTCTGMTVALDLCFFLQYERDESD